MPHSENIENSLPIAVFITSHGFGHAARAAAVMIELKRLVPNIFFHIYTKTPRWFFLESHLSDFVYHDVLTDVGLVQQNALEEDLPATINRLKSFLPFQRTLIETLALDVKSYGCRLILCDIAPLGIAVANEAGIPSILEENFTWDWIYAGYPSFGDQFSPYIHLLAGLFSKADIHIQTLPASQPNDHYIQVNPVSRPVRQPRGEIRQRLMIDESRLTILVTMGGIETQSLNLKIFKASQLSNFMIIGGSSRPVVEDNLILLPHHHGIYHPDLVNACDAVVGKLGYSTLAECYAAGVPFGFIPRKQFPESIELMRFALSEMHGLVIREEEYTSGEWLSKVQALLELPRDNRTRANGAWEIAGFIRDQLMT